MYNKESKGESLINRQLTSFPKDARMVLWMRSRVREYLQTNQIGGPVPDLVAEQELYDTEPYFKLIHDRVRQPIAFSLPNPVLKLLSLFTFY